MIEFRGVDVLLEERLDFEKIRSALAQMLAVPAHRVSVIDDVADYPERTAADVVCVVSAVGGDFGVHLSIDANPLKLPFNDTTEVIQLLATTLKLRCLTPTDEVNPNFMWLISPASPRQKVSRPWIRSAPMDQ